MVLAMPPDVSSQHALAPPHTMVLYLIHVCWQHQQHRLGSMIQVVVVVWVVVVWVVVQEGRGVGGVGMRRVLGMVCSMERGLGRGEMEWRGCWTYRLH